jgi:hypothetical protein
LDPFAQLLAGAQPEPADEGADSSVQPPLIEDIEHTAIENQEEAPQDAVPPSDSPATEGSESLDEKPADAQHKD